MTDDDELTAEEAEQKYQLAMRVDMQRVCDLLRGGDIFAFVDQTGGGCATIYAGTQSPMDSDGFKRWQAVAGPGWFEGPHWTQPVGRLDDFAAGLDDEGDGDYWYAQAGDSEQTIAAVIAFVIKHRRIPTTEEVPHG